MKHTDIHHTVYIAKCTFIILGIWIFIILNMFLITGHKSGELNRRVVKPVMMFLAHFEKAIQDSVQSAVDESANTSNSREVNLNASSSSEIEININNGTSSQQKFVYPTIIRYVYPTSKPYPTAVPGQPGSKEWDDEFWKKWNEMSTKNQQSQQQVEQSQAKFCEENPTLCNK